nr:MAG TPA: hypothetical protein [Caudoviricetes sp.]
MGATAFLLYTCGRFFKFRVMCARPTLTDYKYNNYHSNH